jgi:SNF2 family DNA or RNA helicase
MSPLEKPILEPNCQNIFCGKCILTWLRNSTCCPICRGDINTSELVYLTTKDNTQDEDMKEKEPKQYTQLEKVLDIIKKSEDGKFLIFSAYDVTFDPICKLLQINNISYVQVKGSHRAREKNIDQFKNGEIRVIFLNSNFNGAGINLQEATDIILYHKMPSTSENQIIGRANRIGRTKPLSVHHLTLNI